MTARKKKLKRRSDARSERKPPETVVFFLDRAIGKRFVAEALSNRTISFPKFTFEIKVELLDDYFQHDTPDEKWWRFVGEKGWIVLTKDKRIRYRTVELEMVRKYKVQMFTLSSGNLTGEEMAI